MPPIPIYRFLLPTNDMITYNFDPTLRDENGDGVVTLERLSRPAEPSDTTSSTPLYPEPKPGEEFYRYTAEDGADVRYQYDPGSRNGKDYVVAIHREPSNWMKLRAEDLGVKGWKERAMEERREERASARESARAERAEREKHKEEGFDERRDSAMNLD